MKQPTGEDCCANAKVLETQTVVGYACWYPQMGGYCGKAVAVFDKHWTEYKSGAVEGGCIDVYVWHDGEFPFGEGEPVELHHCNPQQFIDFGEFLKTINDKGRADE